MSLQRPQILMVGNWKMNQSLEEIKQFFIDLSKNKMELSLTGWIAPQSIHIPIIKDLAFTSGNILVGAQNCSEHESGAYTGEISAKALVNMGVDFTLIGHSERRAIFGETSAILRKKVITALNNKLKVIFCVGEDLKQRENGMTQAVVENQLKEGLPENIKEMICDCPEDFIIAYEPVWAIGTGKTASPEQAQEIHAFIRTFCNNELGLDTKSLTILYGGSVKSENVSGLLAQKDIDGGLVGGASLKGESFSKLLLAAHMANIQRDEK